MGKVLFRMELDRTEGLSSTVSDVGVTLLFTFISGSLTAMFIGLSLLHLVLAVHGSSGLYIGGDFTKQ